MYIKNIHINSFGTLRNFDCDFARGLNIIEGENESGKTAVAMFIKFIFYGLSGRAPEGDISERKRFVNWDTGEASGTLSVSTDKGEFRIERRLAVTQKSEDAKESAREAVRIVDEATNMPISTTQSPGMFFFGVSEEVFVNTVFVRQLSSARVNGGDVQAAMENILYSADENVNTEKAIEKLDKIRKNLLHKNGNGGEIYELRLERDTLKAALADAMKRGTETIDTEAALGETEKNLARQEASLAAHSAVLKAYETVTLQRKHSARLAAERQLEVLSEELDGYAKSSATPELYNDIKATYESYAEASESIGAIEMEAERISTVLEDYEGIILDEDPERDTLSEYTEHLSSRKRAFTLASLFSFIAAIFSGGLAALSHFIAEPPILSPNALIIALGIAGAAFLIGIVFMISALGNKSKLKAILREWNCDEAGGIQAAVREFNIKADEKRALIAELDMKNNELTDAKSEKKLLLARLNTMCASVGAPVGFDSKRMTVDALAICSDISGKRDAARRKYDTVSARLEETNRQLESVNIDAIEASYKKLAETDTGKKALAMTPAEAEDVRKKMAFASEAVKSLTQRKHALDVRLAELRASLPDPAKISTKLSDTEERLAKLEKNYAAYMLAINSLAGATENLRAGILPRITSRASEIMSTLSSGKYQTVGVGQDMGMSFSKFGMTREIEYLSAGTRDIAYLSLRIALIEVLFKDNTPSAIFDESFARIDEARLATLLGALADESGFQSLVFTCRTLEGELANNVPASNKVKISRPNNY